MTPRCSPAGSLPGLLCRPPAFILASSHQARMLSFPIKFHMGLQVMTGKKPGTSDLDLHSGALGFWPQERVGDVMERSWLGSRLCFIMVVFSRFEELPVPFCTFGGALKLTSGLSNVLHKSPLGSLQRPGLGRLDAILT